MKIHVENHYSGAIRDFEGTPMQLERQLLEAYPFLTPSLKRGATIEAMIACIDAQQAYSVHSDLDDSDLDDDFGPHQEVSVHPSEVERIFGSRNRSDE